MALRQEIEQHDIQLLHKERSKPTLTQQKECLHNRRTFTLPKEPIYLKQAVWAALQKITQKSSADLWEGQQCSPSEFRFHRLYKVDCHKIQRAVMRLK